MGEGYKELIVWKKGYSLTKLIYRATRKYPKDERYGLISQMRRAAVSIIANIAEGSGRKHAKEFQQFISIAIGSCNELGVYIQLSKDLGYLNKSEYDTIFTYHTEVSKMLYSLRNSILTVR